MVFYYGHFMSPGSQSKFTEAISDVAVPLISRTGSDADASRNQPNHPTSIPAHQITAFSPENGLRMFARTLPISGCLRNRKITGQIIKSRFSAF